MRAGALPRAPISALAARPAMGPPIGIVHEHAGARIIEVVVPAEIGSAEPAVIGRIGAVAAVRSVAVAIIVRAVAAAIADAVAEIAISAAAQRKRAGCEQTDVGNTHFTPAESQRVFSKNESRDAAFLLRPFAHWMKPL